MRSIVAVLVVYVTSSSAFANGRLMCDLPHANINATAVFVKADGTADYDVARMQQYAQFLGTEADAASALSPTILVHCREEWHVQSAITFANLCGYKVTVRSGGHSYTGSSSCSFSKCMQLDLKAMNQTSVDGHLIRTGPGLSLVKFGDKTAEHLLSVPHGGCNGVGIGGHYQSSAWGMMTQGHGSGLDHVQSFRMVHASGEVHVHSRDDKNDTVYKAVLGGSPGSWGIITQYTLEGVRDTEYPHTRMIIVQMKYTKANFLAAITHAQFIAKDQEERDLRDLKIILVTAPPPEGDRGSVVYTKAYMLWTGIDSGRMTDAWKDLYLQPFWDIEHDGFPHSLDIPMTLSIATRLMAVPWTNHNDRYAVQAFHSNYWWSDEFLELIATEVDERVAMLPEIYPSFQYMPLGNNSQWNKNDGMNSLSWRDVRAYVDDWMMVSAKNQSQYGAIETRMRDFREKNKPHWQYADGLDRSTWMSPMTTYNGSTDLTNETVAQQYFPNDYPHFYNRLRRLKAELDPTDLFSNKGTIPPMR